MREIDCAYVEENDLVGLYLAGKLTESDAEAFEAHELGCDRCSQELVRAGAIRAALGKPVLVPAAEAPARTATGRDVWTLLAAAAAISMVAVGIRELEGRQDLTASEPAYRGPAVEALRIKVFRESGGVRLSWTSVEDAQSYVVEVIASDGSPVLKREIHETSVLVDDSALPSRAGVSFLARVRALDPMGQVVARSEATPLQ